MSSAKDLFLDALDLDPADREEFLVERCAGDDALIAEVRRLLAGHGEADGVFGERAGPAGDVEAGDRIGPYVLDEVIGEGGFAVVWRARQEAPIRRTVALKLLKSGLETRRVLSRFEAERGALALMDHPGIAKVLDGGVTEAGRPWFTMELVDGRPITEHCDAAELGKDARLRLVLEVCRAVQHAHQKGVVHRDLKPSNVLVTEIDGRPTAKVIDFGIAKAVHPDAPTLDTVLTLDGQVVGTPAYMSPEQVDSARDVDTRADVYALGVLLYELLSGARPFEDETLARAGLAEVLRVIREVDPPRPSTRHTTTHVLARQVKGDLDWIVMRCLEKDRERRYGSAGLLGDELERHLGGEPVMAGPPDFGYRAAKFARRHRLELAFAATVAALLVGGVIASVTQLLRARTAEAAQRVENERLMQVRGFYESILTSAAPSVSQGRDTALVLDMLAEAEGRLADDLDAGPRIEASVRRAIGVAYRGLGEAERAEDQLRRTVELLDGDDPVGQWDARRELGTLLLETGRIDEGRPLLEAAAAGLADRLGGSDERLLRAKGALLVLDRLEGRLKEASSGQRRLLERWVAAHGERHPGALQERNNLAVTLKETADGASMEEAAALFARVVELEEEVRGKTHPGRLKALNNLGELLLRLERTDEALPHLEEALDIKRAVLPPAHPSLLIALNNLASLHRKAGRYGVAIELFGAALASVEAEGDPAAPVSIRLRFNHALCLDRSGDLEAGLDEYQRCAKLCAASMGPDALFTLQVAATAAWVLVKLGRASEAEPQLEATLEAFVARRPGDLGTVGVSRVRLGVCRIDLGRVEDGRALVAEGIEVLESTPQPAKHAEWLRIGRDALAR